MISCVHKWTAYHMLYLCLSLQVSSVHVQHDNSWHSETDSYIVKLLHIVTINCYHISFLYSEPPGKSLDPDHFCKSVDSVCPSHQSWLCCNTPTNENHSSHQSQLLNSPLSTIKTPSKSLSYVRTHGSRVPVDPTSHACWTRRWLLHSANLPATEWTPTNNSPNDRCPRFLTCLVIANPQQATCHWKSWQKLPTTSGFSWKNRGKSKQETHKSRLQILVVAPWWSEFFLRFLDCHLSWPRVKALKKVQRKSLKRSLGFWNGHLFLWWLAKVASSSEKIWKIFQCKKELRDSMCSQDLYMDSQGFSKFSLAQLCMLCRFHSWEPISQQVQPPKLWLLQVTLVVKKRCLADIDAFPSHSASYDRIGVCCSVSFPNEKGNSKVTNWKCQ